MNMHELLLRIKEIEEPTNLYLLNALSDDSGFFSTGGKLLYMSKDDEGHSTQGIETDYLTLQTHVRIKAVRNNQTFSDGAYNIIIFKGELNDPSAESFVSLCTAHSKNRTKLDFRDFFYSLITIFQLPSEQGFKNAIGLYGELRLMKYFFELTGKDISDSWHRNGSMSQFDFSNGESSIEVKTTLSGESKVTIKQSQIFGNHPCYLAAICCDKNDNGQTINELINEMQRDGTSFSGLNFCINLAKELKRISGQEAAEVRFDVSEIDLFCNYHINPFPEIPECVSNLVYKLDLACFEPLDECHIKALISSY